MKTFFRFIGSYGKKAVLSVLLILFYPLFTGVQQVYADSSLEEKFINSPIQITSRTEPVLDMAISGDGKRIIYISGDTKPTDLWLSSADPSEMMLPEKLVGGPSVKSHPAISPDGRFVAYVDTDYDVKGDIYLIDLTEENITPVRLTGRDTEDGGPCFSSDGRYLYFHQAQGNRPHYLFLIDLKYPKRRPVRLRTGGDAMFCVISPDNRKLAFVSVRNESSGNIFILDTHKNIVHQLTGGSAIDMFPRWAEDSQTLYFTRIGSDTNHDNQLTTDDHSIICKIDTGVVDAIPFPVTPLNTVSFKPYVTADRIYFLSDRGGVSNCWALPEQGIIRDAGSANDQIQVAEKIADRLPYDPHLTLLAYINVIAKYPDTPTLCAKAGYAVAEIFQNMKLTASAMGAYQYIRTTYTGILPESVLAEIRQIAIAFQTDLRSHVRNADNQQLKKKSLARLEQIAATHPGRIAAEARLEYVTLLIANNMDMSDITSALDMLDKIIHDNTADNSQKARAIYLKAQIYTKTATSQEAEDTYRTLLINYPNQRIWVDKAVDQIIDHVLKNADTEDDQEKIKKLNLIASENQKTAPALAMGALNRIGDIFFKNDDQNSAKSSYQYVLDLFPQLTTQTAAARLSLAEILYREERFRQAIDLYETEINLRKSTDRIYQLARQGYIRKTISSGEFLFRLGEIPSARSTFKRLIDYDDRIVEAHRGYIKCAAASGDILKVLETYREKSDAAPDDPVWLYCSGLCLTYLNTEDSAEKAEKRITRAIRYDSSVEYYHQTLGYVYEVLETVYNKPRQLERALMSYQKAYFLNTRTNNPENAANLELNLGNIYYLLGQYGKALDFYSRRKNRNIEFSDANTRIVFYKRLGECAFQNNDMEKTKEAYQNALDFIDSQIDPLAPSRAFDSLNKYIKEQILDPALTVKAIKKSAVRIAKAQSGQNLKVSECTSKTAAPPSERWQAFKQQMQHLIDHQEAVNNSAVKLAQKYNQAIADTVANQMITMPRQHLDNHIRQIRQALSFPERLIELKTEISDRLALACQENEEFQKAADLFEQVYAINKKTHHFKNLARNKRSVAYNTYQRAKTATGVKKTRLLKIASDDFQQVLKLVDQYGVPNPLKKKKQALIDISVSTALDAASATQAASGFSADQEKRLAATFISRINLELGHVHTSQKELEKQVRQYPDPKAISEKNRYGVSLLYHRSGLLDNASGNVAGAFEQFADSLTLCLKMGNPKSAAINIRNMISVGRHLLSAANTPEKFDARIARLQQLDRQTTELLKKNTDITGIATLLEFHNLLGVFYSNAAHQLSANDDSLDRSVYQLLLRQQGISHFTRGINLLEKNPLPVNRATMETEAALYLNMGIAARDLGDDDTALTNYDKAIKYSETGVFPDIRWRALVGLGQYNQAMVVLKTVPITRAGCMPMEIINAFSPLAFDRSIPDQPESVLNLVEQISELERFNRLAPYICPKNSQDKAFFKNLYPRLKKISQLKKTIKDADDANHSLLEQRLKDEQSLLAGFMGPDNDNLPPPFNGIKNSDTRNLAVFLMALGEQIDQTADALFQKNRLLTDEKTNTKENQQAAKELRQTYDSQISQYGKLAEDAFYSRSVTDPPDFLCLMAPQPFDTMDLMAVLSEDDAVARIFHPAIPNSPYACFLVTRDEATAFVADDPTAIKQKIDDAIDWITPYIANENPVDLKFGANYPYALSASHLIRCLNSKKPFKQKLLAIPQINLPSDATKGYAPQPSFISEKSGQNQFPDAAVTANTLILTNGPKATFTVPTEPADVARPYFAVNPDLDTTIGLQKLLANASALSLAMVSANAMDHLYLLGNLFSIYGCPGLVFTDNGPGFRQFSTSFLSSYKDKTGIESFTIACAAAPPARPTAGNTVSTDTRSFNSLYLGFRGMTKNEATKLAKHNFIKYVKTGRADFDAKNYGPAMVLFENAISVAKEVSRYDRYLPDLYKYARESAYLAGNLDAGLLFARELADLLEDAQPDTKAHAEALLRLGLMYAKKDDYQNAVPVIERAVDIMSRLNTDKDLVTAFMDLGIVLENATNYDSALSRFKKAADLSQTLNQSDLLGEQYLNIGRVYDLRLNQYATAIVNYEKALKIYTDANDTEKIAESQLDIGRCYRLLGNFMEANKLYSQSLARIEADTAPRPMLKVKILIEQANNAWFQAKYQDALRLQRQCYTIAEKSKLPLMQVISLNTEGLIWWTLGDYDKALAALDLALEHADRLNVRKDEVATTLNNIGLIVRDKGAYDKALEIFDRALAIDTDMESKWGQAYDFRNKGLTYLKMNQPDTAADLFDRAYNLSIAIGNRINAAKAVLGKGDALVMLKAYENAQSAYNKALSLSREMRLKETIWRSLFGLAKIQIDYTNNSKEAEKLLREAVDVIESMRADLKINQLKENFLADKLSVYAYLVRLLADMGKPVEAFEMAERSRSRNFIDLLGSQKIGFASEAENRLYQKQDLIRAQIDEYENLISVSTNPDEQAVYQKSVDKLKRDLQNAMIDIQIQNPQLASLVSIVPIRTDQLIRRLEPGVALVSYYLLDHELFCWILRSRSDVPENRPLPIQLVRIPVERADLEKNILEYRRIIQNLEPYEAHSKALYETLIAPILPRLKGVRTLGIVPHTSLHYLSFATLYSGSDFLVDDYSLFYVPSAGVLEYTISRRSTEPKPVPKVLAIGNPDLGDPMLDLPFAEQEVYSIHWNFPKVTLLTRDKATKPWVMDHISDYNIIHIASHGEFDPVNPLLSAIKLSVPKNKDFTKQTSDGNLEAGEIFGLKINADMVFLSACQTGLGKITAGDDVIGLNRSFFYAGTHTIISSLWRVSDVSTAILIKAFYRRYMREDKADSLRQAELHVKARYPHPGYWGAFTLVGDYL